jgi:hypothetical protein
MPFEEPTTQPAEAGFPTAENPQVSEEEFATLQAIAQRVGGDFGMQVILGAPGQGSYFNTQEVTITLDPTHIAENPGMAKFVSAHEGAHRAITPSPYKMGIPRKTIEHYFSQLGFSSLVNYVEDPAVNTWFSGRFPALTQYSNEVYDESLAKDGAVLAAGEALEVARHLGYWPKFAKYGSEVIRFWHQGRVSEDLDPDVARALENSLAAAIESTKTIPDPNNFDTFEIVEKARERFRINAELVWPEVKKLVEMDINQGAIRQMINEIWDSLPEELKKMIEEAIKKQEKGEDSEGGDEQEGQAEGGSSESTETNPPSNSASKSRSYPADALPEEATQQLQDILGGQPEHKQREYTEQARRELEEVEDKINEALNGKLQQETPASHKEQHKKREKVRQEEKEKLENEQAQQKVREELERLAQEQDGYEKVRIETDDIARKLYIRIQDLLIPQKYPKWRKGFSSGMRPNLGRVMQANANPRLYDSIWERKDSPRRSDLRLGLMLDLSGSMSGEKIHQAFRGVVPVAEVLGLADLEFQLDGFQDIPIPYKRFDQKWDTQRRDEFLTVSHEPEGRGRHNRNDCNSDGFCLLEHYNRMKENLGKDNIIIVFSDGQPAPDSKHRGYEYELETVIALIRKEGLVRLIGIGLGDGTEHVAHYYPNSVAEVPMRVSDQERSAGRRDFVEVLGDLLEQAIYNPEQFTL